MEVINIKPPRVLLQPLNVPQKLLMGPGPSNCSPKVLAALSEQMLGPIDEDLLKIMNEVKLGIKYAFQTNNEMTFAVSGTGHCAMEAAICNVVEPNDIFLVASSGIWGDRAFNIGQRIGAKCHQVKKVDADILHLDKFKAAVAEWNPKVIFICHGDSSTGILQPLEDIANFLKGFACILIVDCVASLGAVPIFMDKWGIDILYSGSQKVLSAPPGLSPISFSRKAVEKINSRKTPVTSFYMDALALGNYWQCDEKPTVYHHTAPVSLVYALREALSILTVETLENCWKRHKLCAEKLHRALEEMGLILFVPKKAHRLPSVTTVVIPAGVNGPLIIKTMKEKFNIDIAGGLGSTANKVWRIGLMGHNCNDNNVNRIVSSLKKCLDLKNLKSSL